MLMMKNYIKWERGGITDLIQDILSFVQGVHKLRKVLYSPKCSSNILSFSIEVLHSTF